MHLKFVCIPDQAHSPGGGHRAHVLARFEVQMSCVVKQLRAPPSKWPPSKHFRMRIMSAAYTAEPSLTGVRCPVTCMTKGANSLPARNPRLVKGQP